jgi:hypothetical protein
MIDFKFHYPSYNMNNTTEIINAIVENTVKATEETILAQLNEFISRGLIVLEKTTPIFVYQSSECPALEIRQSVKLLLKDQKYIEQLEDKVQGLEQQLEKYKKLVDNLKEI